MTDQQQQRPAISLDAVAYEFSNTFSATIARLITEKLELIEKNGQLSAHIAKQNERIEALEREVDLLGANGAG